jgi:hypothetical protein
MPNTPNLPLDFNLIPNLPIGAGPPPSPMNTLLQRQNRTTATKTATTNNTQPFNVNNNPNDPNQQIQQPNNEQNYQ